jgi:hypothetical protein
MIPAYSFYRRFSGPREHGEYFMTAMSEADIKQYVKQVKWCEFYAPQVMRMHSGVTCEEAQDLIHETIVTRGYKTARQLATDLMSPATKKGIEPHNVYKKRAQIPVSKELVQCPKCEGIRRKYMTPAKPLEVFITDREFICGLPEEFETVFEAEPKPIRPRFIGRNLPAKREDLMRLSLIVSKMTAQQKVGLLERLVYDQSDIDDLGEGSDISDDWYYQRLIASYFSNALLRVFKRHLDPSRVGLSETEFQLICTDLGYKQSVPGWLCVLTSEPPSKEDVKIFTELLLWGPEGQFDALIFDPMSTICSLTYCDCCIVPLTAITFAGLDMMIHYSLYRKQHTVVETREWLETVTVETGTYSTDLVLENLPGLVWQFAGLPYLALDVTRPDITDGPGWFHLDREYESSQCSASSAEEV